MELARLRVFQAVADEGSFSRAARALFLSQPGITQHIHALEAELGVPLFDRLGRRTSLPPAGTRPARPSSPPHPAIPQLTHALEAELGVPLFDRLGRRTSLTPAGASLAQHVPQIMGMVRAAETAAREAGGEARRTLRLGVSETLATYVLPPLLGDLQRRLPTIELRLTVGDSAELLVALLNNDIELAFWLSEAVH